MNKYVIVYIDEEQMARDTFGLYFERYSENFEVITISPSEKSVNQIVDEVLEAGPDIVVVDYYLKYSDPTVPVNGDVILQRINDRRPLLPVIIFTFYSREAKSTSSFLSPEKKKNIHTKDEISQPKSEDFKNTVKEYIDYYKALLRNYKEEFAELNKKTDLSEDEQGRLHELDNILENELDVQNAFKSHEKSDEKFERIVKLIDSTQELLQTIRDKKNNE